jgi:hypothetical protein
MALLEKLFINHHIEVHDKGGQISIRLTDESHGPFETIDEGAIIDPIGSGFLLPLKSGGSTPASPEEVVFILSKLKMAVRKYDEDGENPVVIDHFFMPESDEQRLALLKANPGSIRQLERELDDGERHEAPEWYKVLTALRETPGRSLFR